MRSLKTGSLSCQLCSSRNTGQLPAVRRRIDLSSRCLAPAFSLPSGRGSNSTQVRGNHTMLPVPEPAQVPKPATSSERLEAARKKKEGKRALKLREYNHSLPFHIRKIQLDAPEPPVPATLAEHYNKATLSEKAPPKIVKMYSAPDKNVQPFNPYILPPADRLKTYDNTHWEVDHQLFNEEFYDELIVTWFTATQHKWILYTDLSMWNTLKALDKFAPFRKYEKHLASLMFRPSGQPSVHAFVSVPKIFAVAKTSPKASLAWMIFLSRVPAVLLHDTKDAALVPEHFDQLAANLARLFQRQEAHHRPDLTPELRPYPWCRTCFYLPFQLIEDYRYCSFAAHLTSQMHDEAQSNEKGKLFEQIAVLSKLKAKNYSWLSMIRDLRRNPWNNQALGRQNTDEERGLMRSKAQVASMEQEHIQKRADMMPNVVWDIPDSGIFPFGPVPSLSNSSQSPVKSMNWGRQPRIRMGVYDLPVSSPKKGPTITKFLTGPKFPLAFSPSSIDPRENSEKARSNINSRFESQQAKTTTSSPSLAKNPLGTGNFDDLWDTVVPESSPTDNPNAWRPSSLSSGRPLRIIRSQSKVRRYEEPPPDVMPIRKTYYHESTPPTPIKEPSIRPQNPDEVDALVMLAELRKDLENRKIRQGEHAHIITEP